MDIALLRAKVQTSKLLTEDERAYWLQNLEKMNPVQMEKLDRILTRAANLPWQRNMETFYELISKHTAFVTSKL